jgi:hypothetical protein
LGHQQPLGAAVRHYGNVRRDFATAAAREKNCSDKRDPHKLTPFGWIDLLSAVKEKGRYLAVLFYDALRHMTVGIMVCP